jgi:hypothetical protein
MKALTWIGSLTAVAALIAVAAQAQSQKTPQQFMQAEQATLGGLANGANRDCGTSIAITFDWSGLQESDLSSYSPSGWCEAALDGLRRVCADAPGKEAVKEQIKSMTCGFGPERSISLKDGVVDYKMSFRSTNDADFVFESLENAL